jgi:hypothetical protein
MFLVNRHYNAATAMEMNKIFVDLSTRQTSIFAIFRKNKLANLIRHDAGSVHVFGANRWTVANAHQAIQTQLGMPREAGKRRRTNRSVVEPGSFGKCRVPEANG